MIENADADIALVKISNDYAIDLLDLERKAKNPSASLTNLVSNGATPMLAK